MDHRASVVLAVTIVFLIAATVAVILRLLTRIVVVRSISLPDYIVLLAWLIALALSSTICYATFKGLGTHQASLSPEWKSSLGKAEYAFNVLYVGFQSSFPGYLRLVLVSTLNASHPSILR